MSSILIGIICAVIVSIPQFILRRFDLDAPILILALVGVSAFAQKIYFTRYPTTSRIYDGIADFFIHIHARYAQDSVVRWIWRGLISFGLTLFGGSAGIEGAAAEVSQGASVALRTRSEKWSEQKRRTDVAVALAGALAASFQAPFAAIIFCFEVGTGGRALPAVISSITAYIGTLFISHKLGLESDWVSFFKVAPFGRYEWVQMLALGVCGGIAGAILIRFFRYFQESLVDIFKNQIWARAIAGGIILIFVQMLYPIGRGVPSVELTSLLTGERAPSQLMIYLLSELLVLATILSAFGTVGIFWPLFMVGAVAGTSILGGVVGTFVGASAVLAGVLGAPLFAAALTMEMTQNWKLMAGSLFVGVIADQVRKKLKQKPLVHRNLETRGLALLDGRSADILSSIKVSDAMNFDHEMVYENELVQDLTDRFLNSKHPFLAVINRKGHYVGLLTLDLIQEGLENSEAQSAFFEVKDLLYKSRSKAKTIHSFDTLDKTAGIFGEHPCAAVLDDKEEVVGLLFAYAVRAAYDREVARRTLTQSRKGKMRS
jgi:H+/Cl- antiporter ClcA